MGGGIEAVESSIIIHDLCLMNSHLDGTYEMIIINHNRRRILNRLMSIIKRNFLLSKGTMSFFFFSSVMTARAV